MKIQELNGKKPGFILHQELEGIFESPIVVEIYDGAITLTQENDSQDVNILPTEGGDEK